MTKILPENLSKRAKKELLLEFYDFVGSLDKKEAEEFFKEFLTPSEKIILGRRLKIVKMLLRGHNQTQIREKLGVGVSTVQFVYKWVKDELERRKKNKTFKF